MGAVLFAILYLSFALFKNVISLDAKTFKIWKVSSNKNYFAGSSL